MTIYVPLLGTLTLLTVGATALDTTVVVLSIVLFVPSFIVTLNVVVSEVGVLLSVGLKLSVLKAVCMAAGPLLVIEYGPVPETSPVITPLLLLSKEMVVATLSPSASAIVIPEKRLIVALSLTVCPAVVPAIVGALFEESDACTSPLSVSIDIQSPPVIPVFSSQVPSVKSGGFGKDADVLKYKTKDVVKSPSPSSAIISQRFREVFQAILNSHTPNPGQGWSPVIGLV